MAGSGDMVWMAESGMVSVDENGRLRPVVAMKATQDQNYAVSVVLRIGVIVLENGQLVYTEAGRLAYPGPKSGEWKDACVQNGYDMSAFYSARSEAAKQKLRDLYGGKPVQTPGPYDAPHKGPYDLPQGFIDERLGRHED